jgi:hypothetical protein
VDDEHVGAVPVVGERGGHRHRPSHGGVVGLEMADLDDPFVGNQRREVAVVGVGVRARSAR